MTRWHQSGCSDYMTNERDERLKESAPDLLIALIESITYCDCSQVLKLKGHSIDCHVPEYQQLIARIEGK